MFVHVTEPYVGQKVKATWDDTEGTVTRVDGELFWVDWDDNEADEDYMIGCRHVYTEKSLPHG